MSLMVTPMMSRRVWWKLLLVALLEVGLLASCSGGEDGLTFDDSATLDADYEFVIPLGAGERIDAGEPLEILPARLDVRVGEVIRIVNNDDRGHLVGPFYVGANEELSQQFSSPGELIGECTVHPSGQLIVSVTE